MNDIRSFRNTMAENGTEYTLEEAQKAMDAAVNFVTEIEQKSIEDPEYFDKLKNLSFADKQRLCKEFAETGREVTPNEIDDLVSLILYTQE